MYPAVSAVYRRRPADGSTLLLLTYVYDFSMNLVDFPTNLVYPQRI